MDQSQGYSNPPVPPLLGYVREPITDLRQTGHLVCGPGAKRDSNVAGHLVKLSHSQQNSVQRAKKYAMEQSIKIVLMKQQLNHNQNQAKSLQRQQAIVLMCRIYVGSINFDVREENLKTAFGPFGPIKAISMSWDPLTQKHKGFAFVDFETPEAAQIALEQMNGAFISGRNIKVGRPSNMPQAQQVIEEIQQEALEYNRVYVGGVHKDLSQDDIKSVFEAFGTIRSCELAQTVVEGRHKGYGFIEFDTVQAAQDAISSMNAFDLGGQYLRVGRAITPPDTKNTGGASLINKVMPTASAVAAAAATAKIQALDAVAENLGVDSCELKIQDKNRRTHSHYSKPLPIRSSFGKSGSSARDSVPRNGDTSGSSSAAPSRGHSQPSAAHSQPSAAPSRGHSQPSAAPSRGHSQPSASPSRGHSQPSPEPPAISPPPSPQSPPPGVTADPAEAAKQAATAAQQLEFQKKLMEGNEAVTLSQQEDLQIKGQSARHLVMQKLIGARGVQSESRVICLKNMVGPEDVDEDLQEEIEGECSKYGEVENVIIYQERQGEEDDADILVKIFVEFSQSSEAKAARDTLNGRFFGGRTVRAEVYDPILFDEQDFSH